jgi:hypothetical protein
MLNEEEAKSMRPIEELNMLLHSRADLPTGLKLSTEEFEDGMELCAQEQTRMRLGKRIQTKGWNFIRFADGSLEAAWGNIAGGDCRARSSWL